MSNYDSLSSGKESNNERKPNRLIGEKSPYLLQHAYNPVDWYPWGDEAFKKARQEDKLVFLSVGYSTCHWCHVMAHESFEDPEVAEKMNESFISIKVDREERPDIDMIYMEVCQMMTGKGGWPLTIIMTPDKKPIFAATYLPKGSRLGMTGLIDVMERIKDIWDKDRGQILESADRVLQGLKDLQAKVPGWILDVSTLNEAYHGLSGIFDAQNGGFGFAPKFPTPHNLMFMLRYWQRSKNDQALEMVETTLQAMRMGGIYDQVGFGFHRYSTDAEWFVPHFEKMLYDQALLVIAYVEAYQATGKEISSLAAREVIEYVLRDMTSDQGGFYSAEDADSEGEEGKFYLWTADELKEVLEKDELSLMIRLFDIHADGNFEKGRNILRLRSSVEDAASILSIPVQDLRAKLEKARLKLFSARERRVHPLKDDKILVDWNGLMIAGLSRAAQALSEKAYEDAARKAADFILDHLRTPEGRLMHRYKDGAGLQANLDDYAFLVWGLIELYETTFDVKYLRAAMSLTSTMLEHFWDEDHGGFFFTPDDGESLLVRQKEVYDGAVPSGNSVAMLNLLRLSHLAGKPEWEAKANDLASAFSGPIRQQPLGHSMFMSALDFALSPMNEVALVGSRDDKNIENMLAAMRSKFLPNKAVVHVSDEIREMVEFTRSMIQIDGIGTAYVCNNYSCERPTNDPAKMMDLLKLKQ